MKAYISTLSALALLGSVGVAAAEEANGTVESIDQDARTLTLEDGTTYNVAEDVMIETIAPGQDVTVSFEEEGDERTASDVQPAME